MLMMILIDEVGDCKMIKGNEMVNHIIHHTPTQEYYTSCAECNSIVFISNVNGNGECKECQMNK